MATLKQKVNNIAVERTVVANYNDNNVVHKSGNEGIVGTKTFTESPLVPDVADASDASMKVANTAFVKAALDAMFNAMYPVGSYAFGVMPTIGTWEEVVGDRALWLKNDADDGTEIEQELPNIKGTLDLYMSNGTSLIVDGTATGALYKTGDKLKYPAGVTPGGSNNYPRSFGVDASRSSDVYKDGANVQPNAYVMKVYKRVA